MAQVLLRILCFAVCLVGLAFVLSLLVSGSETAHAASVPGEETTGSNDSSLWADPSKLSASATRRASGSIAEPAPASVAPTAAPVHPSTPIGSDLGTRAFEGLAAVSTPVGSLGAGGSGAPDSGPSITQLAVLSAALMGVRWLSQRLRAIELSWRNALITLQIERPG